MTDIYVLEAFTAVPGGGNPAGVVPNAGKLTEQQMQEIAAKLGYSETAFVQDSISDAIKVRFFTPVAEVELCGHATIATFSLLFQLNKIEPGLHFMETRAGLFDVDVSEDGEVFMTQSNPVFGDKVAKALIADSLNIAASDLHPDLEPQIVSTGLRDIIVPVKDLQTLNKIKPDFSKVSDVSKSLDVIGYHLFSLETARGTAATCRNFAPLFGIDEEAATGTASGALSCYLFANNLIDEEQALNLKYSQGKFMNRPSEIKAVLLAINSQIDTIEVGGVACLVDKLKL